MSKRLRFSTADPEVLGGTVVFNGHASRSRSLIDYIESGYSLEEFAGRLSICHRQQDY